MEVLFILVLSYLAGGLPTSIVVAKLLRGVDIRNFGSSNAGATNVLRLMGWKAMVAVMSVDVFKGWFSAAVLSAWAAGPEFAAPTAGLACGFAAIAGHVYPPFAGFRGGRGGAPLIGVLLHAFPAGLAVGGPVLVVTLLLTGYVGLGTILAALSLPFTAYLAGVEPGSPLGYFCLTTALFITFTHRANISRMLHGHENRFEKVRFWRTRE